MQKDIVFSGQHSLYNVTGGDKNRWNRKIGRVIGNRRTMFNTELNETLIWGFSDGAPSHLQHVSRFSRKLLSSREALCHDPCGIHFRGFYMMLPSPNID